MGYFLTTEPETAVPANSRLSPKTHTPASPVKERGYRYYQPETGRWVSRDPIGVRSSRNTYTFVMNDALVLIDPFGLKWCKVIGGVTVCFGGPPPEPLPPDYPPDPSDGEGATRHPTVVLSIQ